MKLDESLQKFPLVPGESLQGFSLVLEEAALELLWMAGEVPREVAVEAGGGLWEGGFKGY